MILCLSSLTIDIWCRVFELYNSGAHPKYRELSIHLTGVIFNPCFGGKIVLLETLKETLTKSKGFFQEDECDK